MLIHRAHRYELDPNNRQRTHLTKHAGCARFACNWGLEQRIHLYKTKEGKERFTNAIEQHKALNKLKKTQFPWMYDVSKCAPQEALRDLHQAFRNFYRGLKTGSHIGFPRFKKKGINDSFRLTGAIRVFTKAVQLPRLGRIRLKEEPSVGGRILSATVTRKADRWFVSLTVEEDIPNPEHRESQPIGVDLGLKKLATLSDGVDFSNPKALERNLRKMKKLSQCLARKQKGSKNYEKVRMKRARLYLRVSNIRFDALHKLTTYLAKNHSQIVIEVLCVSGMMKNRRLARAIFDVGFYEFRRQLEYKSKWYGSNLIVAPRFYPSSKRCSHCGHVKRELSLSDSIYECENCGLVINRDLNAARNLVAASWSETLNACGENEDLISDEAILMKQEPNVVSDISDAS
ncbi:MAG: RNA-guided endonuclease TnpB family protein [Candidatus Thorarchaeota archaeon]|jgi:putative transposase